MDSARNDRPTQGKKATTAALASYLASSLQKEQHSKDTVQHLKRPLERARGRQARHVQCQRNTAGKDEQQNAVIKSGVLHQLLQLEPEPVVGAKQAAGTARQGLQWRGCWRLRQDLTAGGVLGICVVDSTLQQHPSWHQANKDVAQGLGEATFVHCVSARLTRGM